MRRFKHFGFAISCLLAACGDSGGSTKSACDTICECVCGVDGKDCNANCQKECEAISKESDAVAQCKADPQVINASCGGTCSQLEKPASSDEGKKASETECTKCALDTCKTEVTSCRAETMCNSFLDCLLACPVKPNGDLEDACATSCVKKVDTTAKPVMDLTICLEVKADPACKASCPADDSGTGGGNDNTGGGSGPGGTGSTEQTGGTSEPDASVPVGGACDTNTGDACIDCLGTSCCPELNACEKSDCNAFASCLEANCSDAPDIQACVEASCAQQATESAVMGFNAIVECRTAKCATPCM